MITTESPARRPVGYCPGFSVAPARAMPSGMRGPSLTWERASNEPGTSAVTATFPMSDSRLAASIVARSVSEEIETTVRSAAVISWPAATGWRTATTSMRSLAFPYSATTPRTDRITMTTPSAMRV